MNYRLVRMMHYIDSNGCRIHAVVDHHDDKAPWLLFSNSLMTDHTVWDHQAAFFADRYNILRYDQRGHGLSDAPEKVSFDDLSGDVLALLDHFNISKVTYIGLSMGVPTGISFAARNPERVSRMVLSDGQLATQPSGRATWQQRIDSARANGMEWVADDTIARWFAPDFVAAGKAERVRAAAARMTVTGYAACAGALQSYDFEAAAKNLDIPVLLLAGEKDGAMPDVMRGMEPVFRQASLNLIDGAGHIPNLEKATQFNTLVAEFLG